MKVINGLIKDGAPDNKPNGAFEFAQNMGISKDRQSSCNADGFDVKLVLTGDNQTLDIVGKQVTTKGVFIFGDLTDGQRYSVIYWYVPETNTATVVLKTAKFHWSLDNPITCDYTQNYKGDIILIWCDGVNATSNRPMLLNVENPDITLNDNKEILDNIESLYLFNISTNIDFKLAIGKSGNLKGGAYYISCSYELSDESTTNWSMLKGPIFIGKRSDKYYDNVISVKMFNLNPNYKYVRVAVVYKANGVVTGKIYKKFSISSDKINILVSDNTGDDIDLRELIVRKAIYDKINSLTVTNNKLYIAAPTEFSNLIEFQKYVNDIRVSYKHVDNIFASKDPINITSPTGGVEYKDLIDGIGQINITEPLIPEGEDTYKYYNNSRRGFQHGETYALYAFVVLKKTGEVLPAFHIPGRDHNDTEELNNFNNQSSPYFYGNAAGVHSVKTKGYENIPIGYFKNIIDVTSPIDKGIVLSLDIPSDTAHIDLKFNNKTDFYNMNIANATRTNTGNGSNYVITIVNSFLNIKNDNDNQQKVANIINVSVKTIDINNVSIDVTDKFIEITKRKWRIHGGGFIHTNRLNYWHNKNELYPKHKDIPYPTGNVRHHRFPFSSRCDIKLGDDIDLLKPVIDNIYIPAEIADQISHIGLAYAKRTNVNRTIWGQSPVFDMTFVDGVEDVSNTPIDQILSAKRNIKTGVRYEGSAGGVSTVDVYSVGDVNTKFICSRNGLNAHYRGLYKCKFIDILVSNNDIDISHIIPEYIEYIDYNRPTFLADVHNTVLNGTFSKSRKLANVEPYDKVVLNKATEVLISKFVGNNTITPIDIRDTYVANNTGDKYVYIESNSSDKIVIENRRFNSLTDCLMSATFDDNVDIGENKTARNVYRFFQGQNTIFKNFFNNNYTNPNDPFCVKHTLVTAFSKKENIYYDFTNQDLVISSIIPVNGEGYYTIDPVLHDIDGDVYKGIVSVVNHRVNTLPQNTTPNEYYNSLNSFAKEGYYTYANIMGTPFYTESTVDYSKLYIEKDEKINVNSLSTIDNFRTDFFKDLFPKYDFAFNALQDIDVPIALRNFKVNTELFNAIARSSTLNDTRTNIANIKQFKANDIFYLPIDKGKIQSIVGYDNNLYIQQEAELSLAMLKDRIEYKDGDVYLGTADLFDRPPIPIKNDIGESVMCSHPKHVTKLDLGVVVVDTNAKSVYTIIGDKAIPITKFGNEFFFRDVFDRYINTGLPINPYIGNGFFVAKDERNMLYLYNTGTVNFGFDLEGKRWHSAYNWYASEWFYYNKRMYSLKNHTVHAHNSTTNKCRFHVNEKHGIQIPQQSYVDIIFNAAPEVEKRLDSIILDTTYIDKQSNSVVYVYPNTVDSLMVYNNTQCSGIVSFNTGKPYDTGTIVYSKYLFNNFRDAVLNDKVPFMNIDGIVMDNNVDINKKNWFDKSMFINKYFIVRVIMNNVDNLEKIINDVSLIITKFTR